MSEIKVEVYDRLWSGAAISGKAGIAKIAVFQQRFGGR